MARRILDFDEPERFDIFVTGDAEDRSFSLHASSGVRSATVALEHGQAEVLLENMLVVIDELERRGLTAIDISTAADRPPDTEDSPRRATPPDFQAGMLTIAWDDDVDRLIVEARSHLADEGAGESATHTLEDGDDEIPDDAPIGPDVLRVHLRLVAAQRFIRQADRELSLTPSTCPLCGQTRDRRRHRCEGKPQPG